jgi:transposase
LTAAKLVGEIASAHRFSSDAKLARAAGVAPIPVGSGKTNRHRLDRGANRQINATIHPIAVTRLRCHPETQDYIARRRSEGKTTKDAIRCLKRHLTRRIWHLLQQAAPIPDQTLKPSISRHRGSETSSATMRAREPRPECRTDAWNAIATAAPPRE